MYIIIIIIIIVVAVVAVRLCLREGLYMRKLELHANTLCTHDSCHPGLKLEITERYMLTPSA